jgi:hypothetical protein
MPQDERAAWVARVLGFTIQTNSAAGSNSIPYPKFLDRWRRARAAAGEALIGIGRAMLALPEVKADPRFERVQSAVTTLPDLIPDWGGELEALLERGANDAPARDDTIAAITGYQRRLAAATALRRLEQFAQTHLGGSAVYSALDGALAEIASGLNTAG